MKLTRSTARQLILRRATQHRSTRASMVLESVATGGTNDRGRRILDVVLAHMYRQPHDNRTLAQAVFTCRQNQLVKPEVLVAAGFKGVR